MPLSPVKLFACRSVTQKPHAITFTWQFWMGLTVYTPCSGLLFSLTYFPSCYTSPEYSWHFPSSLLLSEMEHAYASLWKIPPAPASWNSQLSSIATLYEFHYFSTVLTSSALSWVFVPGDQKNESLWKWTYHQSYVSII